MGNILKILSQQPQIDSTQKIECPICYLPCRQFKKLHKNPNGQPPHFACIPCRNELFKYWNQPKCPKSHFKKLHPKKSICLQCMTFTTTNCPLCKQTIDPNNPW